MSTDKKRLCLTLPDNIAAEIATMRQQLDCQSDAALYRHLIRLGLDTLKTSETAKIPKESA